MLKILLTDPLGNTAKLALPEDADTSFMLGRAGDCDIVLDNDGTLSRYHAVVRYEQGHWMIFDNKSVNGIRLGKLPVMHATLTRGTRITIGATTLEVLSAGTAAPAAASEPLSPAPAVSPEPSSQAAECIPPAESSPEPPQPAPKPTRKAPSRALKSAAGGTIGQEEGKNASPRRRFEPRGVKRAGGKKKAVPRRLTALEEVEQPTGCSAESLGLPYEFPLQFFLAEPRHAVTAGSVLRFGFLAEEDCCVYLIQHDSMGGISLILPTQEDEDAELHAHRATALPPKSFLISDELVAGPPFGTDTIIALACTDSAPVAAHLHALLAEHPDTEPGEIERLVLERCTAALPEGEEKPRWSSAVMQVETKA